jgi:hypothetical protein
MGMSLFLRQGDTKLPMEVGESSDVRCWHIWYSEENTKGERLHSILLTLVLY